MVIKSRDILIYHLNDASLKELEVLIIIIYVLMEAKYFGGLCAHQTWPTRLEVL